MVLSEFQEKIIEKIEDDPPHSLWADWKWQMRNRIRDLKTFERLTGIQLSDEERAAFEKTTQKFPFSVTPYYLSLVDVDNYQNDPVYRQFFPTSAELDIVQSDMSDPLHEDEDQPVSCVTHRYPDRVLLLVSNMCAMYCRHCTRKRRVGDKDCIPERAEIATGLEYIRNTPQIRDVLLSGGDPLMLSDDHLEWILAELRDIPHVEIIRIGTRIPVILPYRVTNKLVAMLKKYHPVWVNTHFNHPRELTRSAREALARLADAGIPLGNQSVLLSGVNDCPRIMRSLVQKLVANRVRPYYMYQCDLAEGLNHFRTPVGKGIEIMENLIGHTSGLCVPTYVIDAPGGGGKIPVIPNYLISWSTNKVVLRNYEGVITTYKEPDSYDSIFCNRECKQCELQLALEDADESTAIGIQQLLSDHDDTISLVPGGNERHERRS